MASQVLLVHHPTDQTQATALLPVLTALVARDLQQKATADLRQLLTTPGAALRDVAYLLLLLGPHFTTDALPPQGWEADWGSTTPVLVLEAGARSPACFTGLLHFDLSGDGLERVRAFFQRELQPTYARTRAKKSALRSASRSEFRQVVCHCMDEATLLALLFDWGESPSTLVGASLMERLLHLLHRVDAEGVLERLGDWLERERAVCVNNRINRLRSEVL